MDIVNTYHQGATLDPDGDQLLMVLTVDGVGQYAVYQGVVPLPCPSTDRYHQERARQAERIAFGGMKLNYRQAVAWFPAITPESYRD